MKKLISVLVIIIAVSGLMAGCTESSEPPIIQSTENPQVTMSSVVDDKSDSEPGYGAVGSFENPNAALEQMLIYAIQDEYLARAEYEYLINELDAGNPFTNIIKAEENHISMLIPLFEKYEFEVPVDTSSEHLIDVESINAALETGVQAEIDNIAMYEQFLEAELPDDIREVFVELRDGSKNHLAAFQRKLSR